ncbi:hypothetical protein Vafri_492 [Volvox africanus]|nr:hypothetical protein Vafri_492 [Volvox africanus]
MDPVPSLPLGAGAGAMIPFTPLVVQLSTYLLHHHRSVLLRAVHNPRLLLHVPVPIFLLPCRAELSGRYQPAPHQSCRLVEFAVVSSQRDDQTARMFLVHGLQERAVYSSYQRSGEFFNIFTFIIL